MTRTKQKARRGGKQKSRNRRDDEIDDRDKQDNLVMDNKLFEAYYATQRIMGDTDWTRCMNYLRKSLPITFRFSGSRETAEDLNTFVMNTYVPELRAVQIRSENGEEKSDARPPEQLPWYPNGLGWQFHVSKRDLRRVPEFKRFHQFLIYETDIGNVSRQEAVSMIPPLFLEVKPGDTVLDMCAAPGSKTAQLLEALHAPSETSASPQARSPGLLIANDSDLKRAHLLIHQSARISSDKFIVTNLDASRFPWLYTNNSEKLLFQKILCDVPCSGDGTLRKNLGIWRHWNVGNGNGLHPLQLRILQRAMAMLSYADCSRVVYSTCSMNPIENEAVIAAALNTVPGFELADVRNMFPSMKMAEGVSSWLPQPSTWSDSHQTKSWKTWEEYCSFYGEGQMGSKAQVKDRLTQTMFPPSNITSLNMDRCMRFHPHLMNTGGFFVAVLQRRTDGEKPRQDDMDEPISGTHHKRPLSDDPDSEGDKGLTPKRIRTLVGSGDDQAPETQTSKKGNATAETGGKFNEPPFSFLPSDLPQIQSVRQSLDLTSSFPYDHLFIRAARSPEVALRDIPVRQFYLANPLVRSLIENNDFVRMRLIHAGAKLLAKQDKGEVQFRVLDEALETIMPYLKEDSILHGDLEDLKILLHEQYPFFNKFPEAGFRSEIEKQSPGNIFGRFSDKSGSQPKFERDISPPHFLIKYSSHRPLTMALWRSTVSISLMINKKSKSALSLRLFGEDLTQANVADGKPANIANKGTEAAGPFSEGT